VDHRPTTDRRWGPRKVSERLAPPRPNATTIRLEFIHGKLGGQGSGRTGDHDEGHHPGHKRDRDEKPRALCRDRHSGLCLLVDRTLGEVRRAQLAGEPRRVTPTWNRYGLSVAEVRVAGARRGRARQ